MRSESTARPVQSPPIATILQGPSGGSGPAPEHRSAPWHERWWPFSMYHRHVTRKNRARHASGRSLARTVCPCEVRALLHYVTAHGLEPDSVVSGKLNRDLNAYERAREAGDRETADRLETAVMKGYATLTRTTYRGQHKVNGWTILSTEHVVGHIWITIFWGILFFFLAAGTKILSNLYAATPELADKADWLYMFHQLVLVYLFPFFWGGVGACIYLMKTLGDKAAQSTFDPRKLRGQGTRIFLGAIMGAVVVHLFYPNVQVLSEQFAGIGPAGVAFLTGMGVKAIYGALEKVIESVDNVIKSIGTAKHSDSVAR